MIGRLVHLTQIVALPPCPIDPQVRASPSSTVLDEEGRASRPDFLCSVPFILQFVCFWQGE